MTKKRYLVILSVLFFVLFFAAHAHSSDAPLITGVPIDEELAALLEQVVPGSTLPEERRFLLNLNKLLNEDLAAQSDAYKLAAAKLALRMALAINKNVDSIAVMRNPFDTPSDGSFVWALGGDFEERIKWDDLNPDITAMTNCLYMVKDGKIIKIDRTALVDTCGGVFSNCCGHSASAPGFDDAWFQHYVDLGRLEGFSLEKADIDKIVQMSEKNGAIIETLDLRSKAAAEGIADLAKLKGVKHLKIETVVEELRWGSEIRGQRETSAMREAYFDLFPQLPELETIEMNSGPVTETQMQKLGECENLKTLILTNFSVETPQALAPINRLKNLVRLDINPSFYNFEPVPGALTTNTGMVGLYVDYGDEKGFHSIGGVSQPTYIFWSLGTGNRHRGVERQIRDGTPAEEVVEFHDLPKLKRFYVSGITQGYTFSLSNLPSLTYLITDAPMIQGNIFTGQHIPPNLEVVMCSARGMTDEQVRHIVSLKQLLALGLYVLELDDADIFSHWEDAKTLRHLSLVFAKDCAVTAPALPLLTLRVCFPDGGTLTIPTLNMSARLEVENTAIMGEIPVPLTLFFHNVTMERSQHQKLGRADHRMIGRKFEFEELTLTDDSTSVGITE